MKTTNPFWEEREENRNYLKQINWDGLFLKFQLVLSGIFLIVVLIIILS